MSFGKELMLYGSFQERHQELHNREEPIKSMLTKGQEIVDACPPEDVVQITDRLKKLKDLWTDTKERAQKRKVGDFFFVCVCVCVCV